MNKVIMIGRICADPELRQTQSGMKVATYRLAVNRRKKQDGTQEADFFNCVAWDKNAEFAERYLKKGAKIGIYGSLQSRSYDAQDGTKRYVTEIIVNEHEFCESKGAGGGGYDYQQAQQAAPEMAPQQQGFTEVYDDELPFD